VAEGIDFAAADSIVGTSVGARGHLRATVVGQLDEPVALERSLACDGILGFGDLLIDPASATTVTDGSL
jgi:hypothetical protein